jgi:hypothetical protein
MPDSFIAASSAAMQDARLAPTANRSILGIMNEFTFMTETARTDHLDFDLTDLNALAGWLPQPRAADC